MFCAAADVVHGTHCLSRELRALKLSGQKLVEIAIHPFLTLEVAFFLKDKSVSIGFIVISGKVWVLAATPCLSVVKS